MSPAGWNLIANSPVLGRRAALAGAVANLLWGLNPLLIKPLGVLTAWEVLAHRYLWSGLLALIIVLATSRARALIAVLSNRKQIAGLLASSILLGINWGWYNYAIPRGHTLDAALGQLLIPLATVVVGRIALREQISLTTALSVLAGLAGVCLLVFAQGNVSSVIVVIPVTFSVYSLLRKIVPVDPLIGVTVEMLIMLPAAIPIIFMHAGSGPAFGVHIELVLLLIALGPNTVLPFALFAYAAPRMRLMSLGFLAYLPPTIQMVIAVLVFHETLTPIYGVALVLVWAGVFIYSISRPNAQSSLSREPAPLPD